MGRVRMFRKVSSARIVLTLLSLSLCSSIWRFNQFIGLILTGQRPRVTTRSNLFYEHQKEQNQVQLLQLQDHGVCNHWPYAFQTAKYGSLWIRRKTLAIVFGDFPGGEVAKTTSVANCQDSGVRKQKYPILSIPTNTHLHTWGWHL